MSWRVLGEFGLGVREKGAYGSGIFVEKHFELLCVVGNAEI
jgi:hypothetical protein